MTIYKQPDAQAFAENAPSSEIATFTAWLRGLGIAFDETNGFPQMEGINDVLNRITQGIKYLEQYGIPLWRSDLEYPVGASVVYNGIQYRCIAQNTNSQPDLNQLSWQSAIVDNLTTASKTQMLSANQGKVLADMLGSADFLQNIGSRSIRWGRKKGYILGNYNVLFDNPFKSGCDVVIAINSTDGNNSANIVIAHTPVRTGFTLSIRQGSLPSDLTDVTWIAIGT